MTRRRKPTRKARPLRPTPFLVELDNRTQIPPEFIHSVVEYVLNFLARAGFQRRRLLELTVHPFSRKATLAGVKVITGWQQEAEVSVSVCTYPEAYPATGRYLMFKRFPEYVLATPTDALVAILTHELAHWHTNWNKKLGLLNEEFLCEVLSSAAVADYRARYNKGTINICSKP